ncbi:MULTISPECIES: trimeric intracellular cation channel family protein [Desulfosediminicola]|uniref:trimeric intracellular cation channel family protein n=1 Tax=Desulfosediminicola TaxID=2886823 RepID=UPI0010AC24A5|nr:TRIC cation channel family protein [Desulfosediminicola ganghwensis]
MQWANWNILFAMMATVAFASTAVLAIREDKDLDVFGAIVLGLITAVGGGTIRDLILDVPVFWSLDLNYIWVGVGTSILAFYGRRLFTKRHIYSLMLYLDGFGAALFGIQATAKVWDLGFGLPAAPVILGIVTAIGGGLMRDVLAGRTTLLMKAELYAVPVTIGGIAFVMVLHYLPDYREIGSIICILATFAWRGAAIHWNLRMPMLARTGGERR